MPRDLTTDEEQALTALRPVFEAIDRLRNEVERLHTAAMAAVDNLTAPSTTDAQEATPDE